MTAIEPSYYGMPAPFGLCSIPSGEVILEAGGYLKKNTVFNVATFRMATYPVTNAQYALFVADGGYDKRDFWTATGWKYHEKYGWKYPRLWSDTKWNKADYPVAGVSWYEALAYCAWMSYRTGLKVNLPTEQQWQRAAQGDDRRNYPWGMRWDGECCNHGVGRDWQKNSTSCVTRFQGVGDSAFGLVDMAGNVWEWCLTGYETGTRDSERTDVRVLRGGSWYSSLDSHFRAIFRNWSSPEQRYGYIGMRFCIN